MWYFPPDFCQRHSKRAGFQIIQTFVELPEGGVKRLPAGHVDTCLLEQADGVIAAAAGKKQKIITLDKGGAETTKIKTPIRIHIEKE